MRFGEKLCETAAAIEAEHALLLQCIIALRKFCSRVDRGEIKSISTYKEFKEILAKAEEL